jgi:hypothetical protein
MSANAPPAMPWPASATHCSKSPRSTTNLGLVSRDLVRGGTVFVVDLAMSKIAVPGMLLSERLLPVGDYWTPSGSGFPITPEAAWQVQQTIVPALEASEDDLAAMSPEANAELATALIKLGFEEGSTGKIEFRREIAEIPVMQCGRSVVLRPGGAWLHYAARRDWTEPAGAHDREDFQSLRRPSHLP